MQPTSIPNYVAYQNFKPEYNSALMQNNPKQLMDSLTPEETKVAAQLMRIQILANDQKDKFKSIIRPLVHRDVTLQQPQVRVGFWNVFKETIDECKEEFEVLAQKHGSNENLTPFFVSSAKAINKIETKYIATYGYTLPCGAARLEDSQYQAFKKDSIFMPAAWQSYPDIHTKKQLDFFSKQVSYEQAASYLKFLVGIKTHEADMAQEFKKIAENSPEVYSLIYQDYFPEQSPWNVQFHIQGKERLAPGQSLGVCFEPTWGDRPQAFQWDNMGKVASFLPIVGKEWKFVILEGNKVVQWEAGKNRRHDERAFVGVNLSELKFG